MPKKELVRRIDTQTTRAATALAGYIASNGAGGLAAALEVIDELAHVVTGLYVGRVDGAHVGLFENDSTDPDKAWLEVTDAQGVPYAFAGAQTTEEAGHFFRLGYAGEPGIELVEVEGEDRKQIRVDPECLTAGGGGGLAYHYIFHEGGTCKAVNGLTGKTDYEGTDYAVVIQSAINAAGPDSGLIFRTGIYPINTPLVPAQRQTWWLQAGTRFQPTGNNRILDLVTRDRLSFHGTLVIEDPTGLSTSVEAIRIEDMALCYFERIVITNYYRGINMTGTAGGTHENYFVDIHMQVRDRGINMETSCHDNHFGHVWIKGPAPDAWATGPGLRIATGGTQGGNSFDQIEILDMYWGMDLPGAYEVWFGNVIVDNAYGTCIWMSGMAEHLFFDTIWTASSGDGLHIEGNPSVPPITYADKIHINKLYTWLNANWGLRLSGYIKGLTISQVIAQRNAKGVGFEGMQNNNIVIDTLYTLENTEWGLNGANAGSGVIVRTAMIEDSLLNPDTFAVLGGFTPSGKFHIKGVATILSGQVSVTVTHGLDTTPTIVLLGPYDAEVSDAYVSARTATTFTITVATAVTADQQVSWSAYSRANAS